MIERMHFPCTNAIKKCQNEGAYWAFPKIPSKSALMHDKKMEKCVKFKDV